MVALDPLWPERATVGGVLAANDSGALRLRYGGLRDLIIGMTMVLADGTIAKSGGKVVKNVAGYDLHKLMTGSFGTLGVITEVNFRLHPVEQHARTLTCWGDQSRRAIGCAAPPRCCTRRSRLRCCSFASRAGQYALDMRLARVPECLDESCGSIAQNL